MKRTNLKHQYYLVILNGDDRNGEFFLIPTEEVNSDEESDFKFATKCEHPEAGTLVWKARVWFPEDSQEVKDRKLKEYGWVHVEKEFGNMDLYPSTKEEAEENRKKFDRACEYFDKDPRGKFRKFRKNSKNISNCFISRIFTWQNVI